MRDLTNLGSHIIRCFTNQTIAGPGFGFVRVLGIATGPSEHLDAQMLSGGIVGGVRHSGRNPHDAAFCEVVFVGFQKGASVPRPERFVFPRAKTQRLSGIAIGRSTKFSR